MASRTANLDSPAFKACAGLQEAQDDRVMGLALRCLLEISGKRPSRDVSALVSPGEACLLELPADVVPHLRRQVGGATCDQAFGQLKTKDLFPMGVSTALASRAREFLRKHLLCEELRGFREGWSYRDDGTATNAGCGSGLEFVVCRYCGLTGVESAPKHLNTQARKDLHAANKRAYDEMVEAAESQRRAGRAMRKVMRHPTKEVSTFSTDTQRAIGQVRAGAKVTYEPSESTAPGGSVAGDSTDGSSSSGGNADDAAGASGAGSPHDGGTHKRTPSVSSGQGSGRGNAKRGRQHGDGDQNIIVD